MWRKYFGENATIFGVDIDPACAAYDGVNGAVRIGSQEDSSFLEKVVEEMGGVDIILDDGSHIMSHIKASLKTLFPLLERRGLYFIEDLHTCYWREWGGAYCSNSNFFGMVNELVNDIHHWYHDSGMTYPDISAFLTGIHVHDSIVVLEKGLVVPPAHSRMK